jgi:hypothetical protein
MEWTGQVFADHPTVTVQTRIAAPPAQVWPLVSDIYLMAKLSAELSTIVECDEPHCFAWAVGDPGQPAALWRFTLQPDGAGTMLEQFIQMGPGRSGLNRAIDAMPDKEQKIIFVRLREFEAGLKHNLAAIKELAEAGS